MQGELEEFHNALAASDPKQETDAKVMVGGSNSGVADVRRA